MDDAPTVNHIFYGTRKGRISPQMMKQSVRENNLPPPHHLAIRIKAGKLG